MRFYSPFCGVCARSLYLGDERWALAAEGEPSGRPRGLSAGGEGGRRAAPGGGAAGGEVATLSAVLAFIEMGEVGGDSLSSSGGESAPGGKGGEMAGAWEGLRHGWGAEGVSESPAAPLPRDLAPGKGELEAQGARHREGSLVSRGWGDVARSPRQLFQDQTSAPTQAPAEDGSGSAPRFRSCPGWELLGDLGQVISFLYSSIRPPCGRGWP